MYVNKLKINSMYCVNYCVQSHPAVVIYYYAFITTGDCTKHKPYSRFLTNKVNQAIMFPTVDR